VRDRSNSDCRIRSWTWALRIVSAAWPIVMTRNLTHEVKLADQVRRFGIPSVEKFFCARSADSDAVRTPGSRRNHARYCAVYEQAVGPVGVLYEQGSNNWVVDGTMTVTGKPLLANDPHRPVQIPSLRKTVHLSAPGWNAIGAGEPALPGIALGTMNASDSASPSSGSTSRIFMLRS